MTPEELRQAIMNLPCKPPIFACDDNFETGHKVARHAAAELALSQRAEPGPRWLPIESAPEVHQLVLMSGKNQDGGWWRDVGIYYGRTQAGHDFRDKYGADSHPLLWQPLPPIPADDNKETT